MKSEEVRELFDKHNEGLVWLISHWAFLHVTQRTIEDSDYEKGNKLLESLRLDLYEAKKWTHIKGLKCLTD